jgi:hypothetical protein
MHDHNNTPGWMGRTTNGSCRPSCRNRAPAARVGSCCPMGWSGGPSTAHGSSGNASSCRLPSRAETKILNLHHQRRPPFPDRSTLTLHCYKNIILILATLPTTQLRIYFVSSLVRASCYQSSTIYHRFVSPSSHAHCSSAQRHPR